MLAILHYLALRSHRSPQPSRTDTEQADDDEYIRSRMARATELKERAVRILQALQEDKLVRKGGQS